MPDKMSLETRADQMAEQFYVEDIERREFLRHLTEVAAEAKAESAAQIADLTAKLEAMHKASDPSRLERIRQVLAERCATMLDGTYLYRFGSLDADDGRFLLAELDVVRSAPQCSDSETMAWLKRLEFVPVHAMIGDKERYHCPCCFRCLEDGHMKECELKAEIDKLTGGAK